MKSLLSQITVGVCAVALMVFAVRPVPAEAALVFDDFISLPGSYNELSGATISADGGLYSVNNSNRQLVRWDDDGTGWALTTSWTIPAAFGTDIEAVSSIGMNRVVVADELTSSLLVMSLNPAGGVEASVDYIIDLSGTVPAFVGDGIEAVAYSFDESNGAQDVFYVGVEVPAAIVRVVTPAGSSTLSSVDVQLLNIAEVSGIADVDGSEELYVVSQPDGAVYSTTFGSSAVTLVADASLMEQPEGVFIDTAGTLHVIGEGAQEYATWVDDVPPPAQCQGLDVTWDMNLNGGNGYATPGDDVILGTPGDDVITARGGNDVVCAGDGDDAVRGGPGEDRIAGDGGADELKGDGGVDVLIGGTGDDVIHGGPGDDEIYGSEGRDRLLGGGNNDLLNGGVDNDELFGQIGDDELYGGDGIDILRGSTGNDLLRGGADDDGVYGALGNDVLFGGGGNDVIRGNQGNDQLYGEDGDDFLSGGDGDDSLVGGGGAGDSCYGNLGVDSASTATCESIFSTESFF